MVTDLSNPNTVRASVGTVFSVPIGVGEREEGIRFLKEERFKIVCASPEGSTFYDEVEYRGKVALVLGSEQYGLDPIWFSHADSIVKIPMYGSADSLNVAIAGAVLLYEVVRQRRRGVG
jgi:TrmH family RNA methyltransferase